MTNTIDTTIDMDENNCEKNTDNNADNSKNIGNESVKDQDNNAIMDDKEDVVMSDIDIAKNITIVKDTNADSITIPVNDMKLEENDTDKEINTNVELDENKISRENHTIVEIDINTTVDCTVEKTDTKTEICENIIDETETPVEVTSKTKPSKVCDTENQTNLDEITPKDSPGKECDVDKDEIKVDLKTDTTMDCKDIADFVNDDDDDKAFKRYRLRKRTAKSYIDNEPPPSKKKKINKEDVETKVDLSCDKCYQTFDTKRGYSCHMARHNQPEKFTCAQCSMEFLTNKELKDHKKVHDGEECIFTCGQCKVAYSSNFEYLLHKVEHKPKHFKCEECGKMCMKTQMLTYKDHLFSHFNDTYKCDVCQKHFKTRQCYLKHVESHDAKSKKTYLCGECGKDCKDKKYYDYHMTSHTGVKAYQCLYCGIGFSNANQRKTHTQRIHTNERPFKCPMCDLTFKQAMDVKSHMGNKHNTQKFQCTICKKQYKQKNSLMFHMRIHTKKDLIPCPACDEKFTIPANLKAHYVYRHTNEKPFKCDVCNMAFKLVGALRRHIGSRMHKNNAYGVEAKRKKLEMN